MAGAAAGAWIGDWLGGKIGEAIANQINSATASQNSAHRDVTLSDISRKRDLTSLHMSESQTNYSFMSALAGGYGR